LNSIRIFIAVFFAVLLSFCSYAKTPSGVESIGEYSNGCIKGAVELKDGEHFQVQHWGVYRNFGHPQLIDYINKLVAKANKAGLPDLLIGDLSRPLGGSFGAASNHGSHQTGLDVDISFDFSTPRKSEYELNHPEDVYIVDTKNRPTKFFDNNRVALLYMAAQDPRVERIFVAPGIKKTLCQIYEGHDKSWLQKIRPWFGHRGHMHVRLGCPTDSPSCVKQAKAPNGDGCGAELASWFIPPPPSAKPTKPKVKPKKIPPARCQALFKENNYN
jgi:penicillin-insensitive murein endopeptidase